MTRYAQQRTLPSPLPAKELSRLIFPKISEFSSLPHHAFEGYYPEILMREAQA
jgi:hypothetical protein